MLKGNYKNFLRAESPYLLQFFFELARDRSRLSDLADICLGSCQLPTVLQPDVCREKLLSLDKLLYQRHCLHLQYKYLQKYYEVCKKRLVWALHEDLYRQYQTFRGEDSTKTIYAFACARDLLEYHGSEYRIIQNHENCPDAPPLPTSMSPEFPAYEPFRFLFEYSDDAAYFTHLFSANCLRGCSLEFLNQTIDDIQHDLSKERSLNESDRKTFSYYASIDVLKREIESIKLDIQASMEEFSSLIGEGA